MKKPIPFLLALLCVLIAASCSKDANTLKNVANIYTINAFVGAGPVKINPGATTGFSYAKADVLNYGAMIQYGNYPGNRTFTVVNALDTSKTLTSVSLNLKSINSLYIVGQSPAVDTIFRTENNFPFIQSATVNPDSSIYVRFVNLSPNSTAVKVNIRNATVAEASNLGYKQISEFIKYKAIGTTANYVFEFRDAGTDALLATHTLTVSSARFKTIALVMRGLSGTTTGADAFGISQANYN